MNIKQIGEFDHDVKLTIIGGLHLIIHNNYSHSMVKIIIRIIGPQRDPLFQVY